MTCKGVKSVNLGTKVLFLDYKACLVDNTEKFSSFFTIRSYTHHVHTVEQNKLTLSRTDDKRYILPCGVMTLAYGHAKIPFEFYMQSVEAADEDGWEGES
ncbi:hypothetical protein B566_EDAN017893 [Ephemera danica]|nr:hypothetical protein B566_EDAN017893 [Ephemera danica]